MPIPTYFMYAKVSITVKVIIFWRHVFQRHATICHGFSSWCLQRYITTEHSILCRCCLQSQHTSTVTGEAQVICTLSCHRDEHLPVLQTCYFPAPDEILTILNIRSLVMLSEPRINIKKEILQQQEVWIVQYTNCKCMQAYTEKAGKVSTVFTTSTLRPMDYLKDDFLTDRMAGVKAKEMSWDLFITLTAKNSPPV